MGRWAMWEGVGDEGDKTNSKKSPALFLLHGTKTKKSPALFLLHGTNSKKSPALFPLHRVRVC